MITAATLATPMALFTRRSRSGWLDELDDIRGQALAHPNGEVALAMGDAHPLPEVAEDRSPLADLEAPLPPARIAPTVAPEPVVVGAPSPGSLPPLASELRPRPVVLAAVATSPPLPDPPSASMPVAGPPPASELPPPPPSPPVDRAALTDVPPPPVRSELPPPPPPPAGPATPVLAELPPPPPPPAMPSEEDRPLPSATQPAPHPIRPHEMWHPAVVTVAPVAELPPPPAPEEQVDPADLVEPDADVPTSRFRFARLRPVLPAGDAAPEPAGGSDRDGGADTDGAATAPYSLIEELLAPYGVPPAEVDPETVGHGTAPYVPAVTPVAGSTLINGPVNRRTQRDDEFVRRRELNTALPPERVAARPPVEPLDAPAAFAPTPSVADGPAVAVDAAPIADRSVVGAPPAADDSWDPAPGIDAAASEPVTPTPAPVREAATSEAPAPGVEAASPVVAEPESAREVVAEPAPVVPEILATAADGTVDLHVGHLRLADDVRPEIGRDADGVALTLTEGWCWTVLADGGQAGPVRISMPAGTLSVPAGTSALAVVEADRTSFVVVVAGEASLAHPGGRLRLRPGAMVLAPLGAEPQVDVASEEEIHADPLVARNLGLDAAG